MNRTHTIKHSVIQIRDTQGHTINIVPNYRELTENSEQTVSDQGDQNDQSVTVSDKQDDNTNIQTEYGRISRKQERHTY